jgi:hypothetical protein
VSVDGARQAKSRIERAARVHGPLVTRRGLAVRQATPLVVAKLDGKLARPSCTSARRTLSARRSRGHRLDVGDRTRFAIGGATRQLGIVARVLTPGDDAGRSEITSWP